MKETELDTRVLEFMSSIAAKRQERGLSYEQLGRLAGVHRTTISLIERRKFNPTLQMCLRIADALEISLPRSLQQTKTILKKPTKAKKQKKNT